MTVAIPVLLEIHTCAICNEPPNARGCLILYEDANGEDVWVHRLCAVAAG